MTKYELNGGVWSLPAEEMKAERPLEVAGSGFPRALPLGWLNFGPGATRATCGAQVGSPVAPGGIFFPADKECFTLPPEFLGTSPKLCCLLEAAQHPAPSLRPASFILSSCHPLSPICIAAFVLCIPAPFP